MRFANVGGRFTLLTGPAGTAGGAGAGTTGVAAGPTDNGDPRHRITWDGVAGDVTAGARMAGAGMAGAGVVDAGVAGIDVAEASGGVLPADPSAALDRFDEVRAWAAGVLAAAPTGVPSGPFEPPGPSARPGSRAPVGRFGLVVPRPRQVFNLALNYHDFAAVSGQLPPATPLVLTKFVSSLAAAGTPAQVVSDQVDWEAELVVVIGRESHRVAEADAWSRVAALTVGQDLTDRRAQALGPQWSMCKSYPAFGQLGAVLVTPDELADPDDLAIGCLLNGTPVQRSRTSDMIFSVPELVSRLSAVVTLYPGDLIFTGTPAGVAQWQPEPRWLRPGDVLTAYVEGLGDLTTPMIAPFPT
jgi:2-keto-4-pentenoate hydratase/2-oxohepta-3-ene-1,7-dioic acid hydratase in catechol pathway